LGDSNADGGSIDVRHSCGKRSGAMDPYRMRTSFTVLGQVTAVRAGSPVPLSGQRMVTMLTALLLTPNEPVPADRLIKWVWAGSRSAHPRATLQNAMFRLRHAVGDDVVETTSFGYRSRVDATTLDLLAFEQLVAGAADAERGGDTVLAVDRLRQAIGLWRLPLLANVDAPEFKQYATTLLTERYLTAHQEYARLSLRLGRHADVVADLSDLVGAYSLREPLAAYLMAGLARAGRRADALVTYEAVRRTLNEELGVQPGAELRSLHAKILCAADHSKARISTARGDTRIAEATGGKVVLRTQSGDISGRRCSVWMSPAAVDSPVSG
jgi:DNA-binding SARP family transcriptional activator